MTNTNLLKGKIKEKGLNQTEIAQLIGISHAAFNYKINNNGSFSVDEIMKICEILNIKDKDAYFFA